MLAFAGAYGRITMDTVAGPTGDPMVLLPWQRHVIERVYARDPASGRRRHRRALVSTARKNGKTGMAAVLALWGLLAEGDGAQVYSCAVDTDQASLVFDAAARMVAMDPELSRECIVRKKLIEVPRTGSIYRALSSDAFRKEGYSPSLVIYDELHAAPDRELYDVMSLAMGTRIDPLMVIVTTAGVLVDRLGQATICHQLYERGRAIASGELVDDTLYMAWWEPADPEAAPDDADGWLQANPSLGRVLDPADMASALPPATPENEYRTKRLNQWVVSSRAWLPHGAWEAIAEPARRVTRREPVILGFDGSWTNDSTAIVGCTVERPHLFTVAAWERPPEAASWVVPSADVQATLEEALERWDVREIACDPHFWREQLVRWQDAGMPILEWPTNSLARMVPACRMFYTSVVERKVTHDGDPRLTRHVANAVVKEDHAGARIVKQVRGRKIDLAVAAVIALDRALLHEPRRPSVYERRGIVTI